MKFALLIGWDDSKQYQCQKPYNPRDPGVQVRMWRMVTSLGAAAALMCAAVPAQSETRRLVVDVRRPSGAAEVDLRVEDFELTAGGERLEIVSAMMVRHPAFALVVDRAALTAFVSATVANIPPNGLVTVLERLAAVVREAYTNPPPVYQIEFAGPMPEGTRPAAPQVRVLREGLRLSVISTP